MMEASVVRILLDRGADVHIANDSLLKVASELGCLEVVHLLLDRDADVHTTYDWPLRVSAQNGHLKVVRLLLDHGAFIDAVGDYALCIASENGHSEVVSLLLDYGADAHMGSNEPIGRASARGQLETVRLLLEAALQRETLSLRATKREALRNASLNGHLEIVQLLLECGVDVDKDRNDALVLASSNGHLEIVRLLLDSGDIKEALCCASKNGHLEVVRLLLECEVDTDTLKKARHYASYWCNSEVAQLLKDHESGVSVTGKRAHSKSSATTAHTSEMSKPNKHFSVNQNIFQILKEHEDTGDESEAVNAAMAATRKRQRTPEMSKSSKRFLVSPDLPTVKERLDRFLGKHGVYPDDNCDPDFEDVVRKEDVEVTMEYLKNVGKADDFIWFTADEWYAKCDRESESTETQNTVTRRFNDDEIYLVGMKIGDNKTECKKTVYLL